MNTIALLAGLLTAALIMVCYLFYLHANRPRWRVNSKRRVAADAHYFWIHTGTRWIALTAEDVSAGAIRADANPEDRP